MSKRLLDEREVEQEYGVSVRLLQAHRQRGTGFTFLRFGPKKILYDRKDIERELAESKRRSTSDPGEQGDV